MNDTFTHYKIDESNFEKYFKDVRKKVKPEKGDVLACWRSSADFIDGWLKRNVIELLASNKTGAESAQKVMKNLVSATEKDSIRVTREMAEDIYHGVPMQEIFDKPYRFIIEMFYWVQPQYVPNDIHWSIIKTINVTKQEPEIVDIV